MGDGTDLVQLILCEHRCVQFQDGAVVRTIRQKIAVIADVDGTIGFDLFTKCINRWIGDLCEALFEIIKQGWMGSAECSDRLIGTHGNNRLTACFRHGQNDIVQVFPGIMESFAKLQSDFVIRHGAGCVDFRKRIQTDQMLHPFTVRAGLGILCFQGFALKKTSGLQIGFKHIPGFQFPAPYDMGVFFKQDTGFG